MIRVPIARPRMPRAQALRPYLEQIDAARNYSNFGPLVSALEGRLASRLGVDPTCVATVANATAGLTLALLAVAEGRTGVCLIPSWTFVATAHAVTAAGFTPHLVDIDEESWALTPAIALEAVSRIDGPVAAIMPVAPFGAPMNVAAWDRFTRLTGIPVVIDAAAGHDTVGAGDTPSVVSLHATKILGAGEGGYVVCRRPEILVTIKQRSNFGFYGSRNAEYAAFNAKMSEYHAAVGLASMDSYDADTAQFRAVAQTYRARLAGRSDISFQPGFGSGWIGSVCTVRIAGQDSRQIAAALREADIDSRAWWGDGVHKHSAFVNLPSLPLPRTELLARETIGVPFYVDMRGEDVGGVCEILCRLDHVPLSEAA